MGSPRHLMKSYLGLVMLLCIALAISACGSVAEQAAPDPAPTTEADVAAIERVLDEVAAAESAGDAARWGALVTEDVVTMRPNEGTIIGQEANTTGLEELFVQWTLDVTATTDEVVVEGDWAFARASYSETVTSAAGGDPVATINGKLLDILRRQSDGSWKIARRMAVYDP